jgi:hypothetical protein
MQTTFDITPALVANLAKIDIDTAANLLRHPRVVRMIKDQPEQRLKTLVTLLSLTPEQIKSMSGHGARA